MRMENIFLNNVMHFLLFMIVGALTKMELKKKIQEFNLAKWIIPMVIQVHSRVKKYKNLKQPDHVKKLQMKSIKEIQLEHLLVNNKATIFSGIGFLYYLNHFYGVDMDHIICTIIWGFVTSLVTKNIFLILFPKITKGDVSEMLPMRVKY